MPEQLLRSRGSGRGFPPSDLSPFPPPDLSPVEEWEKEERLAERKKSTTRVYQGSVVSHFPSIGLAQEEVKARFNRLLEEWRHDTLMLSDQTAILMHLAHYGIIGLGLQALPYIFRDLANGGGSWFVALRAITQENPVSEENANNARRMRDDWLQWGRAHGYIGS